MTNGNYQYSLVEKLSFVRYGGTAAELKAAEILLEEIEKIGGKGEIMEFTVPAFDIHRCEMSVVSPWEKTIACAPFGLGGDFPQGIGLRPYYASRGVEADYVGMDSLEGCLVMLDNLTPEAYKLMLEKKASAFAVIQCMHYDEGAAEDLYSRPLRPKFLKHGRLPGFVITSSDATEIIRGGAEKIHIVTQLSETRHISRDVLAFIPGTHSCGEEVVVTAHYDSVPTGRGSWDNATGSATIMWLYKHFLENPPRRDMRFIWCGSEEQGLLGARAFIEQRSDEAEKIRFCFNFDMCGTILGPNNVFVTGTKELEDFAELFCKEQGYSAQFRKGVHSSDSAPFADCGVPGIGLSRGTQTSEIHTSRDTMFPLGDKQLRMNIDFANKMISRVVNSAVLPVEKGMPDNIKKELDKYFQRDK